MAEPIVIEYKLVIEKALRYLPIAIARLGYSLVSIDKTNAIINFETGASLRSQAGQKMTVYITEIDEDNIQIMVSGTRKPGMKTQLYDWNEAHIVAKKVLIEFDNLLQQNKIIVKQSNIYESKTNTKLKNVSLTVFITLIVFGIIYFVLNNKDNSENKKITELKELYPLQQKEFEKQRAQFYSEYNNAMNDIQKSQVFNNANSYSGEFAKNNNYEFNNWIGKISTIYTSQGGNNLFFEMTSNISGINISYKVNYDIGPSTDIYREISKLKEGDNVEYSFKFIPDIERGIEEASFSEEGSLKAPEFNVVFLNVRKINL